MRDCPFIHAMLWLLLPIGAAAQVPPASSASQIEPPESEQAEPAPTPAPERSSEQQESAAEKAEAEPPAPAPTPQASETGSAGGALQAGEQAGPLGNATTSGASGEMPLPAYQASTVQSPEGAVDELSYDGPLGSHQQHLFAWIGFRNDFVRDERFDMFASNDAFPAFSLGVGGAVLSAGNLSLAGVLFWETAGREADARGDSTDLRVHRLELGPELRYHVHYRSYGFTRLGLGAQYSKAVMRNQLARTEFAAKDWVFSSELTGGIAVQFFGKASGEGQTPRGWFVAEGGYALSSEASLEFEPTEEPSGAPERSQNRDFGTLSFRAPLFRLAVAASY